MGLRITTWNVNGIRNPFSYQPWHDKRTFVAMFDVLEADIVILQETKIQRKDLRDDMVLVPGWDCYFSLPKHEKGKHYYPIFTRCLIRKFGVVIYTRQSVCAPVRAEEGISGVLCPPGSTTSFCDLPSDQQIGGYPSADQAKNAPIKPEELSSDFDTLDSEGRCVILEFPAFVLIGVYCPATRDESRNAFKIEFINLLDIRIRNLVAIGKGVILAGDLNITKEPIDMANAEVDLRKRRLTAEGFFSAQPRRMFNELLENGTIYVERDGKRSEPVLYDLCRSFHPSRKGMFTCWETKINARPGNYGSRIDYILPSLSMSSWFSDSNIQEGLMGSDHCPVFAVMKDAVMYNDALVNIRDITNPPGMFLDGERLREYSTKDLLPTSGKLLPEFDLSKRRTIRDMFSKPKSELTGSRPTKTVVGEQAPTDNFQDPLLSNVAHRPTFHQGDEVGKKQIPSSTERQLAGSRGVKRELSGRISTATGSKKPRSASLIAQAASPKAGQRSLKGFFKPKVSVNAASDLETSHLSQKSTEDLAGFCEPAGGTQESSASDIIASTVAEECTPSSLQKEMIEKGTLSKHTEQTRTFGSDPPSTRGAEQSPSKNIESWSKLFAKPLAPRCEGHDEPCKTMVTKKPGLNCGRSFWMCARPLGPSGTKESGTAWRCKTFIWCKDQNSTND